MGGLTDFEVNELLEMDHCSKSRNYPCCHCQRFILQVGNGLNDFVFSFLFFGKVVKFGA